AAWSRPMLELSSIRRSPTGCRASSCRSVASRALAGLTGSSSTRACVRHTRGSAPTRRQRRDRVGSARPSLGLSRPHLQLFVPQVGAIAIVLARQVLLEIAIEHDEEIARAHLLDLEL